MSRASSPYAPLAAIAIGFLLLVVVAFAIGGYTREAIIVLGVAVAVVGWAAWGGRRT